MGVGLFACGEPRATSGAREELDTHTAALGVSGVEVVMDNVLPPPRYGTCVVDSARDALVCSGLDEVLVHGLAGRADTWHAEITPSSYFMVDMPTRARVVAFVESAGLVGVSKVGGLAVDLRPGSPPWRMYPAVSYDSKRQHAILIGGARRDGSWEGLTSLWDGDAWTRGADAPALTWPSAVYWPSADRTMLVGGDANGAPMMSLWDGASWSPAVPAEAPGFADGEHGYYRVVLDPATRDPLLLLGRPGGSARWLWQGGAWLPQAPLPEIDDVTSVAWDEERGALLLQGGRWRLDATGLSSRYQTPPRGGSLTYDGATRELVALGGNWGQQHWRAPSGTSDWRWRDNIPGKTSTPRSMGLTYDSVNQRLVHVDSSSQVYVYHAGSWAAGPPLPELPWSDLLDTAQAEAVIATESGYHRLRGDNWSFLAPHGGTFEQSCGAVFAGRLLQFGSNSTQGLSRMSVLAYEDGAWTPLGGEEAGAECLHRRLVLESRNERVLTYRVNDYNNSSTFEPVWRLDQEQWQHWDGDGERGKLNGDVDCVHDDDRGVTSCLVDEGIVEHVRDRWVMVAPIAQPYPSDRAESALDPARGKTVWIAETGTWEWDGTSWRRALEQGREGAALFVPDADGGGAVWCFGAEGASRWDGSAWSPPRGSAAPAGVLAYDYAKRQVIGVHDGKTWRWQGEGWQEIGSAPVLAAGAHYMTMVGDPSRARVALYQGGTQFDGAIWEWDGEQWQRMSWLAGPPPSDRPLRLVYDERFGVLFNNGGAVWSWSGTAWTLLVSDTVSRACSGDYHPGVTGPFCLYRASGTQGATLRLVVRGSVCSSDADCRDGFCTDGVCCNRQRCGTCETCNGLTPGYCSAVTSTEDPDTCPASEQKACSAQGRCEAGLGASCTQDDECGVGSCVEGVCCNRACDGVCESCRGDRNVAGAGLCSALREGCAPYSCDGYATLVGADRAPIACDRNLRCAGNECLQRCASVNDCVDGFVCDSAGACVAPSVDVREEEGCSCHTASRSDLGWPVWLLTWMLLRRRARRTEAVD